MLEQRRDFLRHEQMQFAVGKMFAQGAERGREQHGVAKVFELQGEDFFRAAINKRKQDNNGIFPECRTSL